MPKELVSAIRTLDLRLVGSSLEQNTILKQIDNNLRLIITEALIKQFPINTDG
ncbi:MAG TPA: hypothetical protein VNK03_00735 [Gammaproteobacteria bacterium]|nr:hypothetical protein [Gammaproteobacteria bacterium]